MIKNFKGFRNNKQQVMTAKGRKISSTLWLNRHINDPYVQLAKQKGLRSRSAFKLLEIINKFPVLKEAKNIVDLGCAPGGWLQIFKQHIPKAKLCGIDLQVIAPLRDVIFIEGDFLAQETFDKFHAAVVDKVDLVASDMAVSSTGNSELDHLRNIVLLEYAIEFCQLFLDKGGNFVAKFIRGRDDIKLILTLKENFKTIKQFKPKSSYKGSAEFYLICLNYLK